MSFFCTIFKSTSGSIVSNIASRQFFTAFFPLELRRHGIRRVPQQELEKEGTLSCSEFSKWFIDALVGAGKCHKSRTTSSPRYVQQTSRAFFFFSRRALHTKSPSQSALPSPDSAEREEREKREELLNMVDYYDESWPWEEREQVTKLANLRKPDIIISEKKEDEEWPIEEHRRHSPDAEVDEKIRKLEEAVRASIKDQPHEDIYDLYAALPSPRVPYLTAKLRHQLLHHLATAERDQRSILRYLSVIDDMKATAIPLLLWEWNTAIHFAGKVVSRLTDVELETALRMWREMERSAGVPGNHVTFNILFDMAIKAGKFNLADMIYQEMEKRGRIFNRFHHVSRIYYHGLRSDGDSARKAYKEFVEAGEIVDTVVLNCLICALFNSQEPQPAIQVYERMKILHAKKSSEKLPPTKWKGKRELRKALVAAASISKRDVKLRAWFQGDSIVAPDFITFRTLIQYYAIETGDLEKVTELLDEMDWYKVPPHGTIFLAIFKGFFVHGGISYSGWTTEKLESVWEAFMNTARDSDAEDVFIGKWVVIWALKAFKKCAGNDSMLGVWEEVKDTWGKDEEEYSVLMGLVRRLLDEKE